MNLTAEEKQFIRNHASDDANRLLLGAKKYPQLDVPFLVDQILSRRQIREKFLRGMPTKTWFFPPRLPLNNVHQNGLPCINSVWCLHQIHFVI